MVCLCTHNHPQLAQLSIVPVGLCPNLGVPEILNVEKLSMMISKQKIITIPLLVDTHNKRHSIMDLINTNR